MSLILEENCTERLQDKWEELTMTMEKTKQVKAK